jgi:hypothetical protein
MERKLLQIAFALAPLLWFWQRHVARVAQRSALT